MIRFHFLWIGIFLAVALSLYKSNDQITDCSWGKRNDLIHQLTRALLCFDFKLFLGILCSIAAIYLMFVGIVNLKNQDRHDRRQEGS